MFIQEKLTAIFKLSRGMAEEVRVLEEQLRQTNPPDAVEQFTRLVMVTGGVIVAQKIALTIAAMYEIAPGEADLSFIKYD